MFGFGRKKEDAARAGFREEFESTVRKLHGAAPTAQIAVGHAINMASSLFNQTHGGLTRFRNLRPEEQFAYINKLSDMENMLRDEKGDAAASLGFGLFKMWLGAIAANDDELAGKFANELAYFSKRVDTGA